MIRSAARRIMGMVAVVLLLSVLSGCGRQKPEEKSRDQDSLLQ